jgi:uncharacterized membrane-anchored protein
LSIVAISYYALALVKLAFEGLAELAKWLNPTLATALVAPIVIYLAWRLLNRARTHITRGLEEAQAPPRKADEGDG